MRTGIPDDCGFYLHIRTSLQKNIITVLSENYFSAMDQIKRDLAALRRAWTGNKGANNMDFFRRM